jgi:hypothetical protein
MTERETTPALTAAQEYLSDFMRRRRLLIDFLLARLDEEPDQTRHVRAVRDAVKVCANILYHKDGLDRTLPWFSTTVLVALVAPYRAHPAFPEECKDWLDDLPTARVKVTEDTR